MRNELQELGPYRILGALGKGGMGVVYRAQHRQTGVQVALKTVQLPRVAVLQGLRREIQALARLRHPGIVRIVDQGVEQGLPWYAMELLLAPTLRQVARELVQLEQSGEATNAERRSTKATATRATQATSWEASTSLGQLAGPAQEGMVEAEPLPAKTVAKAEPSLLQATVGAGSAAFLGATFTQQSEVHPSAESLATLSGSASTEPTLASILASRLREQHREFGQHAPRQAVLTLVRRLCVPLAFLHGEGIVHGDLKPENILIQEDGRPVLVDFGLTSHFMAEGDRDALDLGRFGAGTAAYMAPEQIRGELLDARVDLYAVGCILYELLTGRRPFTAKSHKALLAKHLQSMPHQPSDLVSGLPPRLDELVFQLLAKRPRARLGSAEELGAALAQLGAEDGLPRGPAPRPHLFRPGFVGRGDALEAFRQQRERLQAGRGGVFLLGGEAGVGKTRLLLEVARQAEQEDFKVLSGESRPAGASEAASPLQALRKPLRVLADRCREMGWAETERLFGSHGPLLALFEPELEGLPGQEEYPRPTLLSTQQAKARLMVALSRTFLAHAEPGPSGAAPLVLVLEDLHLADELSLAFVQHVLELEAAKARTEAAFPLLLVGTFRTDAEQKDSSTASVHALVQDSRVQQFLLPRLGSAQIEEMVRDMLALAHPPKGFVDFLSRQSEGNPFFVIEYLRTAVTEGLLSRDELGRWHVQAQDQPSEFAAYDELSLPRSVRDLIGRRLESLPTSAYGLLEVVAILGREVLIERLAGLLPEGEEGLDTGLDVLVRHQILQELKAASRGDSLRFVHDKIREVVYERVSTERRRDLHRLAAESLEARELRSEERAELARHQELAGQTLLARENYRTAALQALSKFSLQQAEHLFLAYLRLKEEVDPESLEARQSLAISIYRLQGRNAEAREVCIEALASAQGLGFRVLEGRFRQNLGTLCRDVGRMDEAWEHYVQAEAMQREINDRWGLCITTSEMATHAYEQGRLDFCQPLFEKALALSAETGNLRSEGLNWNSYAALLHTQGKLEASAMMYQRALDRAQEMGDLHMEGLASNNLAILHATQGRLEVARTLFERSLAARRENGDRRGEGKSLSNLAELLLELEDHEGALRQFQEALTIHREIGNRRFEGITLGNLGTLHRNLGHYPMARRLLEQALVIHQSLDNREFIAVTQTMLGEVELQCGNLEDAEAMLDRAEPVLRSLGQSVDLGICLCARAGLAWAKGQDPTPATEEARRLAQRLGAGERSSLGGALSRLDEQLKGQPPTRDFEGLESHLKEGPA